MTSPRGRLVWMAIGLVAVAGLAYLLFDEIYRAFLHNPALNAGIFVVELIGITYIFWQVIRLYPEIAWIERFKRGELGGSNDPEPRLLAPMEAMVRERTGRLTLSAVALRSLLDSISARLDETRDISRYFIGLMVFLGLLGTFWGLLGTIGGVADAIGAISVAGGGDIASLFGQLKAGLQGPLAGMGTAFSASLFGLSGSLLLGYLELQASQAQNRFFTELEDWLAERTRLTGAGPVGDGEQPIPVYIQALLEQTADNLENLQRILGRGEESRMQANAQMNTLFERLGGLDRPDAHRGAADDEAGREPGRDAARHRHAGRSDAERALRHRRAEPTASAQHRQRDQPAGRGIRARPARHHPGSEGRPEEDHR